MPLVMRQLHGHPTLHSPQPGGSLQTPSIALAFADDSPCIHAGVPADQDMAKECYKQAAAAGHVRARTNLGYLAMRRHQHSKALTHFQVLRLSHTRVDSVIAGCVRPIATAIMVESFAPSPLCPVWTQCSISTVSSVFSVLLGCLNQLMCTPLPGSLHLCLSLSCTKCAHLR